VWECDIDGWIACAVKGARATIFGLKCLLFFLFLLLYSLDLREPIHILI